MSIVWALLSVNSRHYSEVADEEFLEEYYIRSTQLQIVQEFPQIEEAIFEIIEAHGEFAANSRRRNEDATPFGASYQMISERLSKDYNITASSTTIRKFFEYAHTNKAALLYTNFMCGA